MVKNKKGVNDLSVCAPDQIQIRKKNIFKQNEWTHVTFTWDTKNGEVQLYINGREVARKVNKSRCITYKKPQSLNIWLGAPGSDRFKAKVGGGFTMRSRYSTTYCRRKKYSLFPPAEPMKKCPFYR